MILEEALKLEHSFEAGSYDVAVVGAGHAGCEAAHACAKLGLKTVLFTLALDSLANLPCNPSIGGTSKGQLVREVDALGGIIGKMADKCAVQMRMLNRSKGPAVYSPRAQEDRAMYSVEMKHALENLENLTLAQAHITDLLTDAEGNAAGVMTGGKAVYRAKAVVICSGTYMESRTIRGEVITESGPDGLPRSVGLSSSLSSCGIPILRFKTGTPVRVNSNSCDFSQIELRIGAFYCRDDRMLDTYRKGGDIHAATTSVIFGIPYEQAMDKNAPDYKERRTIAKNVNFGVFYGLFAKGLQRTLKFKAGLDKSLDDCQEIISNLKAGYPNLTRWQAMAKDAGTKRQYTQTFLGRRRYLPGIRSQDWGRRSFAERCALNTPIQGTAADILKLSLGRLIAGLPDRPWLRPLLQIHDELVFELPEERLAEAVAFIQDCMDAKPFPELDVPLVAEASWGYDFGHMNEMD